MKSMILSFAIAAAIFAANAAHAATVLITGSNRGLGLEFTRQYAAAGWTVIATARNVGDATELKALAQKHKNISVKPLDVVDAQSIKTLAAELKGQPIDVVINNAGVLGDKPGQTLGGFQLETFQQVMGVNAFGALAVSEALRDNVIASDQKKIVSVTSGSGVLSGGGGGGNTYFYGASKTALNMLMRGLANDLRSKGVIVGVVAPGAVDTDMRRQVVGDRAANDQRPEDSVASMRRVIERLTLAQSGRPLNYDGREMPW